VKRAVWGAGFLVILVLFGWTLLFTKTITENSQLSNLATKLSMSTNQYTTILSEKTKLMEVRSRLAALNRFATNRFLTANMLDAFQQAPVEGMQLTALRLEQSFQVTPETPSTKSESGKVIPGRPGGSTEKNRLLLNVLDASANPGPSTVSQFKESLAKNPYFAANRITVNDILLREIGSRIYLQELQTEAVVFKLELSYPDKTR